MKREEPTAQPIGKPSLYTKDFFLRYKDAVWSYMLEHSEITASGELFVKFHTLGKETFEKRVRSRVRGYHRGDPEAQQQLLLDRQRERQDSHDRWLKNRRRGERIKRMREILAYVRLEWLI